MEFWRYYRIIRRRRWLILLGMLICVGAVIISNMRAVPEFMARTTLMESKGMSEAGVDPFPEQYMMQMDAQLRLSNLVNIATSRRVLVNTYQALHDYGLSYDPDEILQHLNVQPEKDTNILAIEVTLPAKKLIGESEEDAEARTKQESIQVASVVAAQFKKVYGDINNSAVKQSREFIEGQLATTRDAMVKAQNALKDYKQQNNISQLDQQTIALIQRLSQAKTDYNTANANFSASKASADRLQTEVAKLPEWEKASEQISRDPNWQNLKQQLYTLENQKASLTGIVNGKLDPSRIGTTREGPNHPDVQKVQRQIEDILNQLKSVRPDYVAATSSGKNQNYANALDRWISAKADELGADARRQALASVIDETRGEMTNLPSQQAKLAELQADVDAATNTYGLMKKSLDEAKIKEAQANSSTALKIVDPADAVPVDQKLTLKLFLALLLSPLLGIGAAFLLHYTDNKTWTAQDAEKVLGVPVLAVVPFSKAHSLPRQSCPEIINIANQMLTSSLWIASQNHDINSIAVVSAEPDTGRSITASNLAVTLAGEGARVVLVDADLRKPLQDKIFGVSSKVGLTNVLSGGATLEDVLVPTKTQGLLLIPSGPVPENPVKLLRSAEMNDLATQLKDIADFVIYDTPSAVAFPDAVLISAHIGNAVIVHSAGRVSRGSEAELNEKLASVGVTVLGALLNNVRREDSDAYFHYRRSYEDIGTAQLPNSKKAIPGS